jgi:hypothetical protein
MSAIVDVVVKGTKYWFDPETGRQRQKTRRFRQTLSPYNRTVAGVPKTREQIMFEITRERDAWLKSKKI